MSKVLRLLRGKENYDRKRFLTNVETLEYIATIAKEPKPTPKPKPKSKETKDNADTK